MSNTGNDQNANIPQPPPVFTKAARATDITVRLSWPNVYPGVEFVVTMDFALSETADRVRQDYLGKPGAERRETSPDHNLDMFCLLLNREPEGFGDFPAPRGEYEDESARRKDLSERARAYFGERDERGDLVMAWFINNAMGTYWSSVLPSQYL